MVWNCNQWHQCEKPHPLARRFRYIDTLVDHQSLPGGVNKSVMKITMIMITLKMVVLVLIIIIRISIRKCLFGIFIVKRQ